VLFDVLWRRLPDFRDLLIGAVPGEIGATSAAALLLGGLVLLYHGYLRWQMVLAFLLAAAITAAVAPLRIGPMVDGLPSWRWLPGLQFHDSSPVGPLYVAFHLLSGGLLLAMFFFAADFATRPITVAGQVVFAAGCGILTILIRLYLFVPGAPFLFVTSGAYLAVLAMNTLTPLIDRLFQPRPFGR
jgi:Na+-translocating ferredoxin:NAD+ oxidoreductase RnfD subunit